MAYMSQETKSKIAPKIKEILKKYNVKGSLSVRNHLALVLKIKSGSIDFLRDYNELSGHNSAHIQVNPYHFMNQHTGKARDFLEEVIDAMNNGNHDNSDSQVDYFDVGWYIDVNIGDWGTPYEYKV